MNPKNCFRYTREDWILRAAGDVSKGRRRAMERHSADCLDCAAIQAQTDALFQQTQTAFRSAAPPSGLDLRLWRETAGLHSRQSAPPRRPPLWRGLAFGTIVAASIAGGAALLLPGSPVRPTIAFAQVEKAMSDIQTVTWRSRVIQTVTLRPGGKYEMYKPTEQGGGVHWARIDPPTLASGGGKYRSVVTPTESWSIDTNDSGIVHYGHSHIGIQNTSAVGPETEGTPRERLLSAILFPRPDEGGKEWQDRGRDVKRTPWRSEKVSLGGKNVLRFETELAYTEKILRGGDFGWKDTGEKWTVWVNPENFRIVKRRAAFAYSNGRQTIESITESDDFVYNAPPPPGIFDFRPDVGTRYSFVAFNERQATLEEETATGKLALRAAAAWNRRDAAAYAAQWDFDYLDAREDQRGREKRLQLQKMSAVKPARPWRITTMLQASTRPTGIFTQETPETAFPPNEPNEFRKYIDVVDAQGKKWVWTLNLRKEGGDFRIIRAEFFPIPGR